jgi:hypothetical protein
MVRHRKNYRLFGGGDPCASSPAFRFVPNPNATLFRSLGAGVPPCEVDSAADDILENLDLAAVGAGEPASGLGIRDEKPDGPGLMLSKFAFACDCGAGRVMKPVESRAWAFALAGSFFFDFFSALFFDNG